MSRSIVSSLTLACAVAVTLAGAPLAQAQTPPSAPAMAASAEPPPPTPMPYKTVAQALAAFEAQDGKDVTVTHSDGWTIVNEPAATAQWTFAPAGHPAYPAAVRRIIHREEGKVSVETTMLCEGPQAACTAMRAEFDALNDRIRQAVGSRQRPMPTPPAGR